MAISWTNIFDQVPSIQKEKRVLELSLLGITNYMKPKESFLTFIGGKKYWKNFVQLFDKQSFSDLFILFSDKVYEDIKEEPKFQKIVQAGNHALITESVDRSMCALSKIFFDEQQKGFNDLVDGRQMGTAKIDPTAWIGQNVFIGKEVVIEEDVKVYPGAVIMSKSFVGRGTTIYPNVTLYPNSVVGRSVIIHAGAQIGTDGYGYNFIDGKHEKIWHLGNVVLEDDVEIGGNCSIDKGTFNETRICKGTKFDNLVHIAHNVTIGSHSLLCGQVGIAGSTTIEDYCVFGGQAAVTNDVTVGAQTQVGGGGVVTGNVKQKSVLSGHPARPVKEWLRGIAFVRKNSLR